ncbi:hypothetical protein ACLOJK_028501 [Asimina triloba]
MFCILHHSKLLQLNTQTLKSQALQNPFLKSHSQVHPPSSFLQFLEDSCGLSPEKALQVSQRFKGKPRNSDSVLTFLKSNGFSDTHIKSMVTQVPRLLGFDAESNLRPKIQFFKDGLPDSDVVEFIALRPSILRYSLERNIKPVFNFLISHLGRNDLVIKSLKRTMFRHNLHRMMIPNVQVLKSCGVPDYHISRVIMLQPTMLMKDPHLFDENVKKILKMGFNPLNHRFADGVRMVGLSRPIWDMKYKLYRSFGWSDEQVMSAFRLHPSFFGASAEKIKKAMNFFVNKLGWNLSYISSKPSLVSLSLEKRILPRQRFLDALAAKGLIPRDKMFKKESYVLSKKQFFENYVVNFQVRFPEILKLYEGIMGGNDQHIKDET